MIMRLLERVAVTFDTVRRTMYATQLQRPRGANNRLPFSDAPNRGAHDLGLGEAFLQ